MGLKWPTVSRRSSVGLVRFCCGSPVHFEWNGWSTQHQPLLKKKKTVIRTIMNLYLAKVGPNVVYISTKVIQKWHTTFHKVRLKSIMRQASVTSGAFARPNDVNTQWEVSSVDWWMERASTWPLSATVLTLLILPLYYSLAREFYASALWSQFATPWIFIYWIWMIEWVNRVRC